MGFVLKKTFWDFYDHLGVLILINILACLCLIPIITFPFVLLSLFYVTRKVSKRQQVKLGDFFYGLVLFRVESFKVGGLMIVFFILPLVNMFIASARMENTVGAFLFSLSVVIFLIGLLLSIYFLPLVVAGNSLKEAFAASLYFVKTNSLFTLGILLQTLMLKFIFLVSGVGIILLLGTWVTLLLNNAFLSMLSIYKDEKMIDVEAYRNRSLREIFLFWQQ